MSFQNDVSFIIDSRLSLYEHQSTYNPNMPLRFLMYLADVYAGLVKDKNIYGSKIIELPEPRFIVFYNGVEERPDYEQLRLSNAYRSKENETALELVADVLNINAGHNKELLKACKSLGDYAEYVRRIREYAKEMPIEDAVERAIQECIKEDILREFLKKNRAEAKAMSIYEYNEEEHMRMERQNAFEDGFEDGFKAGSEQEQANTERERRRADKAEQRVEEAEEENRKLREELEKLKKR